jgi:DNA-binding CsgD family transcriptional regulator
MRGLSGDTLAGLKGDAMNKRAEREIAKASRLPRFTGQQMNGELQGRLPAIKAKAKEAIARASIGRPIEYTPEKGERILAYMAEGYSLTDACDAMGVARSTVYRWADKEPSFALTLTRAREALAEHSFSEALAIPKRLLALYDADTTGELKLDPARIAAAKLATDTLKWYAERLAPRTFADKTRKVEVSGPNGAPIQIAAVTINADALSDEQRDILRLALQSARTGETDAIDGDYTETDTDAG